jgi:NADPH-dependent glutamate synthase beta subunit-like oxidoreductase
MPAYEEEIEAALEEGVALQILVSPVRIRYIEAAVSEGVSLETLVSPVKICSSGGRLTGIECIRNRLGEVDASGRRRPVPVPGTEFTLPLDTLIVAIGERPESETLAGLEVDRAGRLRVDPRTLRTSREGVFAGGDLVTGPYTVVNAIAAGKKAALVIDRYLRGEPLEEPPAIRRPQVFVEPAAGAESFDGAPRAVPPTLPVESRMKNSAEVELTLSAEEAARESCRCLRCDLRFTQPAGQEPTPAASGGRKA